MAGSTNPFRRREGRPTSRRHASADPPRDGQKILAGSFRAVVGGVVMTVRTAVCGPAPVIVAEDGMLQVAGSLAAVGVMAQLRAIAPVNPPPGVRVMVEVLPLVAPGATVTFVPVREK